VVWAPSWDEVPETIKWNNWYWKVSDFDHLVHQRNP
jgi:hypothetical protein